MIEEIQNFDTTVCPGWTIKKKITLKMGTIWENTHVH
jgi:hypothetical protein